MDAHLDVGYLCGCLRMGEFDYDANLLHIRLNNRPCKRLGYQQMNHAGINPSRPLEVKE